MGVLRLILALTVVIAHSESLWGLKLLGGKLAVQSFYMISGFYMALILNEKYIGKNNSYKLFITNRILKLYPIYWVVILLTLCYSCCLFLYTNGEAFPKIGIYIRYYDEMNLKSISFLIFTNIFILFQDMVMFLGLDTSNGELFFTENFRLTSPKLHRFLIVPQAWTLGVEITFYLMAPFIVRKKIPIILLLLSITILLRIFLISNGLTRDPWNYRFFPTELSFFLLGIISYKIYKNNEFKNPHLPKFIFAALLFFTFAYQVFPVTGKKYIYYLIFFISIPYIFQITKHSKIDRYIGELSYPVYISHNLVILIIKRFYAYTPVNNIFPFGCEVIFTTILVAIGLNKFVMSKVEKIRQQRIKPVANKIHSGQLKIDRIKHNKEQEAILNQIV